MKKTSTIVWMVLFVLVGTGAPASANSYIPPFGGSQKALSGTLGYLSGGVGISERKQMEQMAKGYNLKLVFDMRSGDYLAHVMVKIQNRHGKVLMDTLSAGPWFYAKLPAGVYWVTAGFDKHPIVRKVSVGHRVRSVILTWAS
jgi:hypothetical protein